MSLALIVVTLFFMGVFVVASFFVLQRWIVRFIAKRRRSQERKNKVKAAAAKGKDNLDDAGAVDDHNDDDQPSQEGPPLDIGTARSNASNGTMTGNGIGTARAIDDNDDHHHDDEKRPRSSNDDDHPNGDIAAVSGQADDGDGDGDAPYPASNDDHEPAPAPASLHDENDATMSAH
jgi:hypothetical protein